VLVAASRRNEFPSKWTNQEIRKKSLWPLLLLRNYSQFPKPAATLLLSVERSSSPCVADFAGQGWTLSVDASMNTSQLMKSKEVSEWLT